MDNSKFYRQLIFKVIYIYAAVFLFFMLVLNQNRLTNGNIVNVFTTLMFCFLGGFIPFTIAGNYKSNYKMTTLILAVVGMGVSIPLSILVYKNIPELSSLFKVILFISAFFAMNYLVCDYDNKNFKFLKFDVDVNYMYFLNGYTIDETTVYYLERVDLTHSEPAYTFVGQFVDGEAPEVEEDVESDENNGTTIA